MPLDRPTFLRLARTPRTLPGALLLASLALGGASGCSGPEPLAENVILISIDTLRPDHLGCYGYEGPTSPNLDELCRESVVFEQAISHAPSTLSSHASMLSSLLPHQHAASISDRRPLPEDVTTAPEVLQDLGYRTASFNDGAQVDARWGLDQGFDVYRSSAEHEDRFDPIVTRAIDWLDDPGASEAPFFLLLHTYEVHHPYTPSPEDLETIGASPYDGWLGDAVEVEELQQINEQARSLAEEDLDFIVAAYDAEIRSVDRALGRLLAGLRDRGLLESTLLVFTSDHGEEFNEHGQVGWHSHSLYDELLKVPLVVRFPDQKWAGERVRRQVRLIDLAPTVLGSLGLKPPGPWRGVDLLQILRGEEVQPLVAVSKRDGGESYSLRTGRWKYYDGRLFDLHEDPGERLEVSASNWDRVEAFKGQLYRAIRDGRREAVDPVDLDPETRKRLEALGYL
ncbi:MAG: sulfatase [Thermoanaerobaculia bacterium]